MVVPINRLLEQCGFDAEMTARLGAAFDVAWEGIRYDALELRNPAIAAAAREVLAKLTIEEGMNGERNAARLVEKVITRFRNSG